MQPILHIPDTVTNFNLNEAIEFTDIYTVIHPLDTTTNKNAHKLIMHEQHKTRQYKLFTNNS